MFAEAHKSNIYKVTFKLAGCISTITEEEYQEENIFKDMKYSVMWKMYMITDFSLCLLWTRL